MVLRQLRSLWRQLLRSERPKQLPGLWRSRDIASVLLLCIMVAMISSWPWLVEPSLQAGMPAPFTARAPKAARVIDSTALDDRRDQMLHRTTVQVVDPQASRALMLALEAKLQAVEQQSDARQSQVQTIALTPQEREWLASLSPTQLSQWRRDVLQAELRMLVRAYRPAWRATNCSQQRPCNWRPSHPPAVIWEHGFWWVRLKAIPICAVIQV